MASNYTCSACLSALVKRTKVVAPARRAPHKPSHLLPNTSLRAFASEIQLPRKSNSKPTSGAPAESDKVIEGAESITAPPKVASPGKSPLPASTTARLASELRKRASGTTETYIAYGATQPLFLECSRAGNYTVPQIDEGGVAPKNDAGEDLGVGTGWWYDSLGLTPTFNTWAQVTFLHMYLLTVRFRLFPKAHAPAWHQHLLDHFFHNAEDRMETYHGMVARGVRNKYLKDLWIQWRGVLAAYDEGLVKGDAVLAAAVWRNVFKADPAADVKAIAEIVSWMRREVRRLGEASDAEIAAGWTFKGDPGEEAPAVELKSKLMKADA
ncbi:hypothetical protein BU16DRAFT_525174 [Lophium mytilinum]|uniref:Ubiquinol-cytochrome c chaperone domain-containing protein n=1 Tax=Lophium mytilinum TaxID=390894 RepID=A0A6A6QYK2_9PEZI|nr:hypothetical protein BU16DRAFT_525174 [Lophium mytilinum]